MEQLRRTVRQAQAADELAFTELYVRFFHRVFRYLCMRLDSRDDAQEVAQDVFERLLIALPQYDPTRGSVPLIGR
jgi:DNA-directed RNA polymerase specialized sigma24 family protein